MTVYRGFAAGELCVIDVSRDAVVSHLKDGLPDPVPTDSTRIEAIEVTLPLCWGINRNWATEGDDEPLWHVSYVCPICNCRDDVDVEPDEKAQHIFSVAKGGRRRPDADELAAMLGSSAFQAALAGGEKRAPTLCPVRFPPKAALEASTPIGQRMDSAARGHGRGKGGAGRGGKGSGGGGKGVGRQGIRKPRPRASAFAMRAHVKGSG